jgi:hypothetical protein
LSTSKNLKLNLQSSALAKSQRKLLVPAKILEAGDVLVWGVLGTQMSGHALKHLAAAMALWMPLRMLAEREPTASSG